MKRFEEVVNEEFLNKYLSVISKEYPVVDENNKINFGVFEKEFYALNGGEYPNRFIYSMVHGRRSLIPSWNVPAKYKGSEEAIYKYCLDKGLEWQDVLHYEENEDVIL